uniref:Anaphase-promoting complex subunit 4 WD40 domain-containing protein n=1 Tax=Corethron hystrix TaxID=216773 RepID=A0A7S1BRP9_9STRA
MSTPGFVYRGHNANVTAVSFSPTGNYVASGDEHGKLRVWAFDHRERLTKLQLDAFAGTISDISWDGEARRIAMSSEATGGDEGNVKIVQWDTGVTLFSKDDGGGGHAKRASCVAFRPGRPLRVASGGEDHAVNFYKGAPFARQVLPAGPAAPESGMNMHDNYVNCVRFSPDGKYFMSAGSDRRLVLYDGKIGAPEKILPIVHKGSIYMFDWSEDSTRVVTCSADKTVRVVAVPSGEVLHQWDMKDLGRGGMQVGVAFFKNSNNKSQKDQQIVSVSLRGHLNILDEARPASKNVLYGHNMSISNMIRDGNNIYTTSTDGSIALTHIPAEKNTASNSTVLLPKFFTGDLPNDLNDAVHSGRIRTIDLVRPKGDPDAPPSLLTTGWDDTLRISHISSRRSTAAVPLGRQPAAAGSGTFALLIACSDRSLSLYDHAGALLNSRQNLSYAPVSAAAAADDAQYCVGGDDRLIHVYAADLEEVRTVAGHTGPVSVLEYSPDGTLLASGGNREVCVWNVTEGFGPVVVGKWPFHTMPITALAWKGDSTHLASGGMDGNIILWNWKVDNRRVRYDFAHRDGVAGMVWGDRELVSTGLDGCMNIWDVTDDLIKFN